MEEKELLDWAASMGITDAAPAASPGSQSSCLGHSLTISTFPDAGGRGLGAVRVLKEGELILRVPKNALLSLHSAKEDPDLATALLQHQNLSSTQVLTAHLLREVGKGKASKWYLYLKSLPRFYHTLAQFSGFETKALQVEDAIWIAEQAVERARKEWEEARPMLQMLALKDRFTSFKAWLWASATVSVFSYIACAMGHCRYSLSYWGLVQLCCSRCPLQGHCESHSSKFRRPGGFVRDPIWKTEKGSFYWAYLNRWIRISGM